MPRMQTMTRRGWMEEGRVDGSSRAVLMKEAEKLRAPAMENWRYWIGDGRSCWTSQRAVLADKDTDKLSTEAPPDEEYLKLF